MIFIFDGNGILGGNALPTLYHKNFASVLTR